MVLSSAAVIMHHSLSGRNHATSTPAPAAYSVLHSSAAVCLVWNTVNSALV